MTYSTQWERSFVKINTVISKVFEFGILFMKTIGYQVPIILILYLSIFCIIVEFIKYDQFIFKYIFF